MHCPRPDRSLPFLPEKPPMTLPIPLRRLLPFALAAFAGHAAAGPPPTCPVSKSGTCPKAFEIIESPDAPPVVIEVDDPLYLWHECVPRVGGMRCEAWPQEYDTIGYLTYQWTIRVGFQTFTYPPGTNPIRNVNCQPLQGVTATVRITNGSFSAQASKSYGCGNEIP
jgi:hypothetical protein